MAVGDTGTLTDAKDGKVYTWKILNDGRMWMTQNYNYKSPTSICYDNKEANATKYGRMYTRNDAVNNAPAGWRVPTTSEFQDLPYSAKAIAVGGESGLNLQFGGGYSNSDNAFYEIEKVGTYWTFSQGEQNGGKPASFNYILTKTWSREGDIYGIQGAFLHWDHKCYIRYVKDV